MTIEVRDASTARFHPAQRASIFSFFFFLREETFPERRNFNQKTKYEIFLFSVGNFEQLKEKDEIKPDR